MYVTLLGGFLGSGKTTILVELAKAAADAGLKAAIIVNEAGDVGIDGERISVEGHEVVEIAKGCICCSLSGTLRDTLININREFQPDLFLLEPTGLALPHQVEEIIRLSRIQPDKVLKVGVVDAYRFDLLLSKKRNFIEKQLSGSQIILINKCDLVDASIIRQAQENISQISPDSDIFAVSALTGQGLDEVIRGMLP